MLMGLQHLPPATCYLLGMLVTACLGWSSWDEPGFQGRLTNSNSRCQGQLEVYYKDLWSTVCSQSWGQSPAVWRDASLPSKVCHQLLCGEALLLAPISSFNKPRKQIICSGHVGSFSNCSYSRMNCHPLSLICLEPPTTTPPPTSPPPTTTPEPTAPPRVQLVAGPGHLQCAGVVEFYSGGLGGTISDDTKNGDHSLENLICAAVQCGSFLEHLPEAEAVGTQGPGDPQEPRPLPILWRVQNASCTSLGQCFQKIQPQEGSRALALVCSDFQPKVQSRLVGGSGVCEGAVEVRQGLQWAALCDSSGARRMERWNEVCQEQQCGNASSYRLLDTSQKTSRGLACSQQKLSRCHKLREIKSHCKRVFVTCQDPNPAGLAAGTVASIILALVLLVVLLVLCGPLAYKKLVKKCGCHCPEPPCPHGRLEELHYSPTRRGGSHL